MKNSLKTFRKAGVLIAGVLVLIVGAFLLVLPGPGILVIIAGLIILSTEFEWAEKYLKQARAKLKETYAKTKRK